MNMQMFLNFESLIPGHKMSRSSLKTPFSLFVHRLQVSTSHLFKLHTGLGLASKLVVMSQIMLVGTRLELRFKVSTEKVSSFSK